MKPTEIQPSATFKKQATRAIFSIFLFIVTYLVLLVLALVVTFLCFLGGVGLVSTSPSLVTLFIGIGLVSMGVMVLIFLIKFIFKSHKIDRSHLIEITREEQPQLFQLIEEIVTEVETKFPKRIYLSADVNASVFYDSSFWSMFLPVRKNLQIGLGLINTVTSDELKAILSHEFGHFSQRSMKIGSYVYNVNQVIFNMLYENESYNNLTQKWAGAGWFLGLFALVAININAGIQWVLRKLYTVVNKSYMGLSREMEFHADAIAAKVTGYQPLKQSLLRMSFSNNALEYALNFYNGKTEENLRSENLYKDQWAVILFWIEHNHLTVVNGLPEISLEEQSKFDKSKLFIKDQWSSHPSMDERISRLQQAGFSEKADSGLQANELFSNITHLQKQFTDFIFKTTDDQVEQKVISSEEFATAYKAEVQTNSFAELYNGYYNNKNPLQFDLNLNGAPNKPASLEELISDEKVDWVYTAIGLQNDIETLKNIAGKQLSIKTFDYAGTRYKQKDAEQLALELQSELDALNKKIQENDSAIYVYFKNIEAAQPVGRVQLEKLYSDFFDFDKNFESKYNLFSQLMTDLQFVTVTTPFDQIKANLEKIKPVEEKIKQEITLLLSDNILSSEIKGDMREMMQKYLSGPLQYFHGVSYDEENLNTLSTSLNNYAYLLSRKYFLMKKAILDYQSELQEKFMEKQSE